MFDSVLYRSDATRTKFGAGTFVSIAVHVGMIALAIYLSSHQPAKQEVETVVKFFAAPPPPPPPPPPKAHTVKPDRKIEPRPIRKPDTVVTPREVPKEPEPEESDPEDEGVEGGVEGGVKGGVVGGVLGGVVGGTLGGTGTGPPTKVVPSFVLDQQRIAYPNPHLPEQFVNAHPKQTVQGLYRICVDTTGKVNSVTTITPIGGGADEAVVQQVSATWKYKSQPVPICTIRQFRFEIR